MSETVSIARTIPIRLQSSTRKMERVQTFVDRWQAIARYIAEMMPSFDRYQWGETQYSQLLYTLEDEFPDNNGLRSHDANQAAYKVTEAFGSWKERGCEGEYPIGEWGDANYGRLCNCGGSGIVVEQNNDDSFGVRLGLEEYAYGRTGEGHEWFTCIVGDYQREYLRGIVDGDVDVGASEIRLKDGTPYLHLVATTDVVVAEMDDVETYVGVDLGENTIYATAVLDESETIHNVEQEPGDEFRHHRERLDEKRARLQEQGKLNDMKAGKIREQRRRYTKQMANTVSKRIVDLASEHYPSAIICEDLTDYRTTADDPIHDWPYAEIQENITYKAKERGIPVQTVDPSCTSMTCRRCNSTNPQYRDGDRFECWECGYRNHADVNAAMNVARRAMNLV